MNLSLILIMLLLALSAATLLSVAIALYLNRWRRRLLANPQMVFEEEFGDGYGNIDAHVAKLDQLITNKAGDVQKQSISIEKSISNLGSTFIALQTALDERDTEIRRLKEGYDRYIFEKFVRRFIRVDQTIEDFMVEGGVDEDGLKQIHEVLEDALDECGVERFSPETGEDFRYANGVADNPKTDAPKTQEEEYKIVEILEPGYRICGQEGYRVIVPSKVRINGMWEGVTQK